MLNFVYVSDLHIDNHRFDFNVLMKEEYADSVLLIVGDTFTYTYQSTKHLGHIVEKLSKYFRYILIVLGNHDYWGCTLLEALYGAREAIKDIGNAKVLSYDEVFVIDDIAIFGDTLWSDIPPFAETAIQGLNDYQHILSDVTAKLTVYETNQWNALAKESLCKFLVDYKEYKKLVVTHFPPLFVYTGYEPSVYDSYFGNSGIEKHFHESAPLYYIFGHTHTKIDIVIGDTHLLTNPRGYVGENGDYILESFSV